MYHLVLLHVGDDLLEPSILDLHRFLEYHLVTDERNVLVLRVSKYCVLP